MANLDNVFWGGLMVKYVDVFMLLSYLKFDVVMLKVLEGEVFNSFEVVYKILVVDFQFNWLYFLECKIYYKFEFFKIVEIVFVIEGIVVFGNNGQVFVQGEVFFIFVGISYEFDVEEYIILFKVFVLVSS